MTAGLDLLVVGGGPTGIAVAAEAKRRGLDALIVERGGLTQSLLDFPVDMTFFTTRDLLEIADVPFTIAEDKPSRRQALRYYRAVAARYQLAVALHEEVTAIEATSEGFAVATRSLREAGPGAPPSTRRARHVAVATGYFDNPRHLGVVGENAPWVRHRYREPYPHFGEHVAVIGGGNSAAEAALDLWRNGARVTLVHRGGALKPTVKYWLKPDVENRLTEGSIAGRFDTVVRAFDDHQLVLAGPAGEERLAVDAAYVLIGYEPTFDLLRRAGVEVDARTLVPRVDAATCESNVPGLYVAGTLQAGRDTGRIFIENSRDHALRIVASVRRKSAALASVVLS